ncbi:MAG: TraR/DksA family transcriptional regulator [Hyphomicrobiaceae bacterium]
MRDFTQREEQLKKRMVELDGRLHRIDDHLHQAPDPDWEENATESEMDEVLEGLGQAGAEEMQAIYAALTRIKSGTYGICVRCGEDISDARLDVLPHTSVCKTCAAQISA